MVVGEKHGANPWEDVTPYCLSYICLFSPRFYEQNAVSMRTSKAEVRWGNAPYFYLISVLDQLQYLYIECLD
jgi:hypothetical protein